MGAGPSKPILFNGFEVQPGITILKREANVLFTEVYSLSDGTFLYLLKKLESSQLVKRANQFKILKIEQDSREYVCVVLEQYTEDSVSHLLETLTTRRGFDCVAGMKNLKDILTNDVIHPLLNPERFEKFKISIPNGILLFGPPGCGKTFIVRKLAEELNYEFIELKHSDVASPYIHGSVGKIGNVFEMAKFKAPAIIFIDEIEGLVPKRENLDGSSTYKQEEINEFLMQLNDAGKRKILVVAATNRPHLIDSAILRSGRMDQRIYVPPPDFDARRDLFDMYLAGRPLSSDIDHNRLAEITNNFVTSDIELIVNQAARYAAANNLAEISMTLLVQTIEKFNPSISDEEISYYQNFGNMERW